MAQKTLSEKRERQKKLVIILVGLVVVMGAVVWFGFGLGGDGAPVDAPRTSSSAGPLSSSVSRQRIVTVSLDLSIFESPEFLDLQVFGDLPIIIGEMGRSNPLVPVGR